MLRCISGPNLVILAWTADELWGGQTENYVKFDFQVKFDLEGQGQSSPKTIGTLTKVFCTLVKNLVILAWTSDEWSCGQARDWHTHTRTHRRRQRQYPKAKTGLGWKLGKFWLSSSIWPWRSPSVTPQNYRDLNQGLWHLWSKFGDPSLNGWWIIARTSSWLTDRHTYTHAGNDNTRRPILASGKNMFMRSLECYFGVYL